MAQSYSNSGGYGNRTALITVTTTATLGAGAVTALIEGTQANSLWFAAGQSGREVKFDFGTSRLITEAIWYQNAAGTHGTWQWQGSPDNSSWTSIGSTFTLGSPAMQVITTLSGNVTSYRYYRMLQTSGTTSSSPFLREVEFNIDGAASNTAWSTTDNLNVVLSNGTLTCTTTGSGNNGARSTNSHTAGQYYFEFICTTWGPSTGVGFANAAAALSTVNTTSTGACYVQKSIGTISFNGVDTGLTLGARADGNIIGVALDTTAARAWFRVCPTGNWNGNASFGPGGTGGINISAISSPLYGLFCGNGNSLVVTGNFGGSAFSGAVPSGYTAGFPAGADVVGDSMQVRAMVLA